MSDNLVPLLTARFDAIGQRTPDEGIEFWFARDLMELLDYARWENFLTAIHRAIDSCKSTGYDADDHFRDITKMIELGKGGQRQIEDFMLTRYACYLIAQNGNPHKQAIAFAQSYFAEQTRKQKLIEDRMRLQARLEARDRLRESEKTLSQNIYARGVDDAGFGRIRAQGDKALFGGIDTQMMKQKYGIVQARSLADFLPTLTIAAKNLVSRHTSNAGWPCRHRHPWLGAGRSPYWRSGQGQQQRHGWRGRCGHRHLRCDATLSTEMTNHNVQQANLQGEQPITREHIQNNQSVRKMLGQRGIQPENLPAEENIQKLERRVKSDEKRLQKQTGKLPKPEPNGLV